MNYNKMNKLRKITFQFFTLFVGVFSTFLIVYLFFLTFQNQQPTIEKDIFHLVLIFSFTLAVCLGFLIRYIDRKLILLPREGKGKELKNYMKNEFGVNITPEQEEKIKIYVLEAYGIYGRK